MMISEKMASALNEQIAAEFGSYYVYLSMAFRLEELSLPILAKWFYIQADEESEHAMKMSKYLVDQGVAVKLQPLGEPKYNYKNAVEICKEALEHEKMITRLINDLVFLARDERDLATENLLQWFVAEQVEEVASTTELLELVKLADTPSSMIQLEERIFRMVQTREAAEAGS